MGDRVLSVRLWPILGNLRKWPCLQGDPESIPHGVSRLSRPILNTSLQFLPVIGRIVSDAIEGKLDPAISQRFAVDRKANTLDRLELSHGRMRPVDLNTEPLCTPEDLLPHIGEDDAGGVKKPICVDGCTHTKL